MRTASLAMLVLSACAAVKPAPSVPVSTEVDPDQLMAWVAARKDSIQLCYQKELGRDPTLHGTVGVLFTLGASGRASDIRIEEDTVKSAPLVACIKSIVGGWEFPFRPTEETEIAYPFVFAARSTEQ